MILCGTCICSSTLSAENKSCRNIISSNVDILSMQVYLAMAKGGLTPDHTLICPIAHYPSTVELPDVSFVTIYVYKS